MSDAHSRPAAEYVALSALVPWDRNPRKIGTRAIKKVAASIRAYGFASPIIAQLGSMRICAGHTRYLAAKELRLADVPVRFMDLTDEQFEQLALADNRTNEETEWDDEKLADVLSDMKQRGVELQHMGFDMFELGSKIGKTDELALGAPRIPRTEDLRAIRIGDFKVNMSIETFDRLHHELQEYVGERGTQNGFVEHLLAGLATLRAPKQIAE